MAAKGMTPEQIQIEMTRGAAPDPSQAEAMREALKKAGRSEREIQAALSKHGHGEAPPPPIVPIEGMEPASASNYVQTPITLSDGTDAGKTLRAGLEAAGLPAGIGNAILSAVAQSNGQPKPASDAEKRVAEAAITAQLRNHWKDYSETPEKLQLVTQAIGEIESQVPGFRDALFQTGGAYNPLVMVQLAAHVQRVYDAKWGENGVMANKAKAAKKERPVRASELIKSREVSYKP